MYNRGEHKKNSKHRVRVSSISLSKDAKWCYSSE